MITNPREYLITRRAETLFGVDKNRPVPDNRIDPAITQAIQDGIASQREDLHKQVVEFEKAYMTGRKGDWMPTFSGGIFWLLDPHADEVAIEDVAHALSLICRYNGHITGFYSVAQHCVLVSEHCRPAYALYGLLHDAAEAYTGDIITPLKRLLPNYKDIEEKILAAVCKRFSIRQTKKMKTEVKYWDNVLLATEVRDLIPYKYLNWKIETEPLESSVFPLWTPEVAEQRFLARFNKLYGTRKK